MAQYFLGRYEYAMDDRGRVPIPPRYSDLFARGGMLNQGPDPCLRLFTNESFEEQAIGFVATSVRGIVERILGEENAH